MTEAELVLWLEWLKSLKLKPMTAHEPLYPPMDDRKDRITYPLYGTYKELNHGNNHRL